MKKNNVVKTFLLFPLILFSFLFLRLFDLQLVQGKELRQQSENNRFFKKRVLADRGVFLDRFGQQLVYNKPLYYKLSQPQKLYSERQVISREEALKLFVAQPQSVFVEQYREYIDPLAFSQVLGYVGKVTREDLQKDEELHLEQVIGKTGLERVMEKQVRGTDGGETYELNARGEIQRSVALQPAIAGENITLSIDKDLTLKAYELMQGKKGAVMVGDAESGEVLALVSTPTYESNLFTTPTSSTEEGKKRKEQIQQLFTDPRQLFFNRALAGAYPPGSVFKLVVAAIGLERKAFDTSTIVVDEGVLKVDEYQYGNWYFRQYGRVEGPVNITKAISRSNDIFFYKAAEWIGPDKLAESSRLFGLGTKTGIELPSEANGLVPDPEWKLKTIGERWYLGNTYHYGIGQGDITVTPAQVFQFTSAFANRGKMCSPTLIKGATGKCKELGFSEENIQAVKEGMIQACSTGGTGYPFFEWNETHDQKVACKTGTAEFGGTINEKGHRRTHGWFTAVAELGGSRIETQGSNSASQSAEIQKGVYPRKIVFTVLVESDDEQPFKEGSRDAGPIAFELLKWIEENR